MNKICIFLVIQLFLSIIKVSQTSSAQSTLDKYVVQGFDYEFALTTVDAVNSFLDHALTLVTEIATSVEIGLGSADDLQTIRKLAYTTIISDPKIGGVVIELLTGHVLGYINVGIIVFFEGTVGPGCNSSASFGDASFLCIRNYLFDDFGDPSVLLRQTEIPANGVGQRFLNVLEFTTHWATIADLDQNDAGIIYGSVLKNISSPTQDAFAVGSAIMYSRAIDEFLYGYFGVNGTDSTQIGDNSVVFIINDMDDLVGASIPGVSYHINPQTGLRRSIKVTNCSVETIRKAGSFVVQLPSNENGSLALYVYEDLFIQQMTVARDGLSWRVVSVSKASFKNDFIQTGSNDSNTFIVVATIVAASTVFVIMWIVQFRHLRLWQHAQPASLFGMLIANLMCAAFIAVLGLSPSQSECIARSWIGLLAVEFACATSLIKAVTMYHASKSYNGKLTLQLKAFLSGIVVLVFVQIVLLAIQTRIDSDNVESKYVVSGGDMLLRKTCVHNMEGLQCALLAGVAAINAGLLVMAWIARNSGNLCDESKALLLVAIETSVLSAGYIVVELVEVVTKTRVETILEMIGMAWYVVTMQLIVFGPRVYRQYSRGDLTVTELREMIRATSCSQPKQKRLTPKLTQQQQQQNFDVFALGSDWS
eukprot:c12704_g1_i2.p1 GENE.c12704_g1_i2~~c12704_g1_i2.p1  ORF type:complete len:662 (+),score=173.49 c12704_g1_i2:45-1988(+)